MDKDEELKYSSHKYLSAYNVVGTILVQESSQNLLPVRQLESCTQGSILSLFQLFICGNFQMSPLFVYAFFRIEPLV